MPPRNPPEAPAASREEADAAGTRDAGTFRGVAPRASAAVARRDACASEAPPGRNASRTSPAMSLVISLNGSSHTSLVLEPISFKELDTEGATFDVTSCKLFHNFWLASALRGIGRPTVGALPG